MRWLVHMFLLLVCFSATVSADDALTALNDGDYAKAIRIGSASNSAEDMMAAARAHMVLGGFYKKGDAALAALTGAKALVNKVLVKNENDLEARTTLALILGFQAKEKMSPGRARKVKNLMLETVSLHRESGMAHGALAGWHSEVSAAGLLPRIVLGASRSRAARKFDAALQRSPKDMGLQYQYGKFLGRGNKAERAEAIIVFKGITAAKTELAVEKVLQERAANILAALHSGSKRKIKRAIKANSAFSGL